MFVILQSLNNWGLSRCNVNEFSTFFEDQTNLNVKQMHAFLLKDVDFGVLNVGSFLTDLLWPKEEHGGTSCFQYIAILN